ncbi:hypothetical protein [Singapore grouper iridovirus]|nr:hypothetical protein [Singapore grouper iridovirus]
MYTIALLYFYTKWPIGGNCHAEYGGGGSLYMVFTVGLATKARW